MVVVRHLDCVIKKDIVIVMYVRVVRMLQVQVVVMELQEQYQKYVVVVQHLELVILVTQLQLIHIVMPVHQDIVKLVQTDTPIRHLKPVAVERYPEHVMLVVQQIISISAMELVKQVPVQLVEGNISYVYVQVIMYHFVM